MIRAICRVEDGNGRIRIQDITNNQTIATSGSISNTSTDMIVVSQIDPNNLPTNGAIWQIQLIKDSGSGNIILESLVLSF